MTIYTVHARITGNVDSNASDDTIFVKDGFSWPAFVFTFFWLLYKRMWIAAAIVLATMMAGSLLATASGNANVTQSLIGLALSFILGFEGNDLLRWSLARRGFREVGLVQGRDLEEAELKYYSDQSYPAPEPANMASMPTGLDALATDALGLFSAPGIKQ
jgi:hypothetical protein